jgi:hypothetical protein
MYRRVVEVGMRKLIGKLAAVAGAGVLTFAALPAGSASAYTTNGLQVYFCPPAEAVRVLIQGINQNRQYSEWNRRVPIPGDCSSWGRVFNVTKDWWWEGTIAVSYTYPGSDTFYFHRTCEVPKQGIEDTYGWC